MKHLILSIIAFVSFSTALHADDWIQWQTTAFPSVFYSTRVSNSDSGGSAFWEIKFLNQGGNDVTVSLSMDGYLQDDHIHLLAGTGTSFNSLYLTGHHGWTYRLRYGWN